MSVGAIGALGAVGIGAMSGMGAAGVANALASGGAVASVGSADGVVKSTAAARTAGPTPSTRVDISGAARSTLAGDGIRAQASMSELAQALILALLLQLLQNSQGSQGGGSTG